MWNKYKLNFKFHLHLLFIIQFHQTFLSDKWNYLMCWLGGKVCVWYGFLGNSTSKCIYVLFYEIHIITAVSFEWGRCFLENSVQIQILMKSNVVILCPTIKFPDSQIFITLWRGILSINELCVGALFLYEIRFQDTEEFDDHFKSSAQR